MGTSVESRPAWVCGDGSGAVTLVACVSSCPVSLWPRARTRPYGVEPPNPSRNVMGPSGQERKPRGWRWTGRKKDNKKNTATTTTLTATTPRPHAMASADRMAVYVSSPICASALSMSVVALAIAACASVTPLATAVASRSASYTPTHPPHRPANGHPRNVAAARGGSKPPARPPQNRRARRTTHQPPPRHARPLTRVSAPSRTAAATDLRGHSHALSVPSQPPTPRPLRPPNQSTQAQNNTTYRSRRHHTHVRPLLVHKRKPRRHKVLLLGPVRVHLHHPRPQLRHRRRVPRQDAHHAARRGHQHHVLHAHVAPSSRGHNSRRSERQSTKNKNEVDEESRPSRLR